MNDSFNRIVWTCEMVKTLRFWVKLSTYKKGLYLIKVYFEKLNSLEKGVVSFGYSSRKQKKPPHHKDETASGQTNPN